MAATFVGATRLSRLFQDVEWQEQALCHGRLSLFFVERNSDNRKLDLLPAERKAKALCVRCPVRRECLEYGIDEDYGIWGGTLPSERKIGGKIVRANKAMARSDIDTLLDEMFEQAVKYGLVDREDVA